jgi:hypothetical protein
MAATEMRAYNLNYVDAFNEVQYALAYCQFNIDIADFRMGYVRATTGISIASYGETIEVNIGQSKWGMLVYVQSKPSHYFTDMGKSRRNVRRFFYALDSRIGVFIVTPSAGPPPAAVDLGGPGFTLQMEEPDRMVPILLVTINGIVTFLLSFWYLTEWVAFGFIVICLAILMLLGVVLMIAGAWKVGAIVAVIGAAPTIPLGILGLIGASKAWDRGRWQKNLKTFQML